MMTQPYTQPMGNHIGAAIHRLPMPLILLLLVAMILPACATSKPTLVLLVGGSGLSQLGDLGETISAMCPDADVVETGGWDGFRADLRRIVKDRPSQGLILIGHSFGCQTIAEAAAGLPAVDLVVMIDPAWNDLTLPPTVFSCLWYQRSGEGLERRATIRNGGRPKIIPGDHNDICHSPQLLAEVAHIARGISERKAAQQRIRKAMAPAR